MPKLGKVALLPMILSAALAAAAGAQAASDCNIDENTTISMSVFALMAAQQPGTSAPEQTKQLQTAIGRMFPETNPANAASAAAKDNAKNPVGRAFVLGRIYMMFLSQEDMPVVTTRGALGFKTNPTGLADLSVGIDSAFKVVEEKAPQCQPLISQWRQQGGWVKLVQKAMDYANANKVDSADIRGAAGASHFADRPVLAPRARQRRRAAQQEHGCDSALQGRAGGGGQGHDLRGRPPHDPLHPRQLCHGRRDGRFDQGEQGHVFRRGRAAFEALSKDPGKQYGEAARQGLTAVLRASGDTAAIHNACQPQVANPSAFSFLSLVQCGVTLAEINDVANATKIVRDGHDAESVSPRRSLQPRADADSQWRPGAQSGGQRSGRHDTTAAVRRDSATKQYQRAIRPSTALSRSIRRIRITCGSTSTPITASGRSQLAQSKAYGDRANALTSTKAVDQTKRKALIDSAAKMDPLQRASLNMLVEWNTKADSMPVQVIFSEVHAGGDENHSLRVHQESHDHGAQLHAQRRIPGQGGKPVGTGKATVDKVRPEREQFLRR